MVGKRRFFEEREVDRLQIICKECSARLHAANADDDMHNLWELIWVRDNFVHLLATVLSAQMSDSSQTWADAALADFCTLAAARFPDTATGPIDSAMERMERGSL